MESEKPEGMRAPAPPRAPRAQRPAPIPAPPVAPAAAEVEPAQAAEQQRRIDHLESVLRAAGLLEAPSTATRRAGIEGELEKLELQRNSVEAAVAGGLDPESVKSVLADLKQRTERLKAELVALQRLQSAPEPIVKPPLLLRVEALEAAVARLEARLSPAPAARALPASPPSDAPAAAASPVSFEKGFALKSADGAFVLQPVATLQTRFAYNWLDDGRDEAQFSVPRGRIGLKGNVFTKDLKYFFLADFGQGATQLVFCFTDYTFVPKYLSLRVGHFKRPFSRAFITPNENMAFVGAPSVTKTFGDALDLGVMLHNGPATLEYALGVFNGTGAKGVFSGEVVVDPATGRGEVGRGAFGNVPARFHPALVARLAYNHAGIQGYSESDLERGPSRFSIAAAGLADFNYDEDSASFVRGTLDAVWKLEGFSVSGGAYVSSAQDGPRFRHRALEATAVYAQTGYVLHEHYEPVLRSVLTFPAGADSDVQEFTGGLNLYFVGHALKLQTNTGLRRISTVDGTTSNVLVESQFQLAF